MQPNRSRLFTVTTLFLLRASLRLFCRGDAAADKKPSSCFGAATAPRGDACCWRLWGRMPASQAEQLQPGRSQLSWSLPLLLGATKGWHLKYPVSLSIILLIGALFRCCLLASSAGWARWGLSKLPLLPAARWWVG